MNTCFLFVSNIPKSLRSSVIMKEIDNKWSDIVIIENQGSDVNDAFIYNPTTNAGYFDICVEKIRKLDVETPKPLKVYYVWIPGPSCTLVTTIPDGSILLPYIIVDCVPKELDADKIYGELPFSAKDVKQWSLSYKEDKWIILKLPATYDEVTRNFILSYTRTYNLANGGFPRATEVIITEEDRLSKTMVPICIRSWIATKSTRSNLIFLYDLPVKFSSPHIQEALKLNDMRHLKCSLIETIKETRAGFIVLPKTVSDTDYDDYMEKLSQELTVPSLNETIKLNLSEVWIQPNNCLPPKTNKHNSEFILTPYLMLSGVHESVSAPDISARSPYQIKVILFQSTSSSNYSSLKFGFVSLRGINSSSSITKVIEYIRSLVFCGRSIQVDEIWLRVTQDSNVAPKSYGDYTHSILSSRDKYMKHLSSANRAISILEEIMNHEEVHLPKIYLPQKPPFTYQLQMTQFLFIMNLEISRHETIEELLKSLQIHYDGAVTMDIDSSEKIGIVKISLCSDKIWMNNIEKLAKEGFSVRIIYIQHDEDIDLIQFKLKNIHLSQYILVRDIDYYQAIQGSNKSPSDYSFIENVCPHIDKIVSMKCCSSLDTIASDSYGFLRIGGSCTPTDLLNLLEKIRSFRRIGNGFLGGFTIWLGEVTFVSDENQNGEDE